MGWLTLDKALVISNFLLFLLGVVSTLVTLLMDWHNDDVLMKVIKILVPKSKKGKNDDGTNDS